MIHVAGHTAIDHISRVGTLPHPNSSATITDRKIFYGGGAANIAAGIACLGGAVTLVSAVGSDFAGSDYDAWMDTLGIRKQFYVVPGTHTPTAFMFTDEAGDQVTFFEWGASGIFHESEPPSFPFVHMATADPVFNVKVASRAEFSSFDPGQDLHRYTAGQLREILSHISLLFANNHEVEGMCRMTGLSPEDIIGEVPMAVFTSGSRGSTLHIGSDEWHIPAIPVSMIDPTGAGDAYRAGFLTAFTRGLSPLTCCRAGTVCASFVVEVAGCQTNLPDWGRMAERYGRVFGNKEDLSGTGQH
ncbi:MAG: carbohydrate kinase family protein [Methanomicrobiales archaeon]|nr:carbohydrate kinase family protein [Methanomicrobiales archaeon]NYT20537.1 carbohydrate kinase family protein [Methanomicrobiales archaeon]